MKLKELYSRFCAWQQDPFRYEEKADLHTCANCSREFEGDYCPVCGQKHDVGRVS